MPTLTSGIIDFLALFVTLCTSAGKSPFKR